MNRPSMLHPVPRTACLVLACLASTAAASLAFSISGTVRNPAAAPVANVNVLLYDDNGNPIGIPPVLTNAAGFYSVDGLPSGRYGLDFEPPTATKLLVASFPRVEVNNANVTLNVTLQAGFLLSGFVRDGNGAGVADIDLNIEDRSSGQLLNTPGDNTDPSGFYDVVVPAGDLRVTWRDVTHVPALYVRVVQDLTITTDTTVDVTMLAGVYVTGVVRNTGGTPLANANLDFIDAATGIKLDTPGDVTDGTGTCRVHIPPTLYDIRVKPDPLQRLVGVEIVDVPVASDTTIGFTLQPGRSIAGFARRTNGVGEPGVGIDVRIAGTSTRVYTPNDVTDATGRYEVFVLPGTYDVTFEPPVASGLAAQRVSGLAVNADTPLSVTLQAGVLVSGSVRTAGGQPVAGVDMDAKRSATGIDVPVVGDFTDGAGNFAVILVPDTYDLEFEPPIVLGLVALRMAGVVISGPANLPVTLQNGFTVSGTATDSTGALVRNTDVNVVVPSSGAVLFTPGDKTDAWGKYRIVIPGGTYRFVFTPDPAQITAPVQTRENVVVNRDLTVNVRFPSRITTAVGEEETEAAAPRLLVLHPNRPNPFNPTTALEFDLARPGNVELSIYDARGRLVRTFRLGRREAGRQRSIWDGTDRSGRGVPSGTYFYCVTAEGAVETRKMTLVR